MTSRGEKRFLWVLAFCVGVALAMLPVLFPSDRYALFDLSAGCLIMAVAGLRLWVLRRRLRRPDPWLEP